jgi:hypothetical protein
VIRSIGAACFLTVAIASVPLPPSSQLAPTSTSGRWYRGNTHTHTLNSDGDSTPDEVVRWYRAHGYQFLVLTDHNFLTATDALNALHGADDQFLVIKGEEVTERLGSKSLHINGLDVGSHVAPQGGASVTEVLQRNIDAIRQTKGVPHINHPNFGWSISRDELQHVRNYRLLEIFSGHPLVNNLGGGGVPGMEDVWDAILSSGAQVYGIGVDDAHTFKDPGNPDVAGPGRAWVVVRAPRLEARTLLAALERGEFYASTGVELTDYRVSSTQVAVAVKATAFSKYRIQFIGKGGRLLREVTEPTATYVIRGDEGYVRARVLESNGRIAWCQPAFIQPRSAGFANASQPWMIVLLTAGLGVWRWRYLRAGGRQ